MFWCRPARRSALPAPFSALTAWRQFGDIPRSSSQVVAAAAQPGADVRGLRQQHSLTISDTMSVLASTGDIYDGVNIDAEQLPSDPAEFADSLQHSLQVGP